MNKVSHEINSMLSKNYRLRNTVIKDKISDLLENKLLLMYSPIS